MKLIITEKPKVSKKIAQSLSGKYKRLGKKTTYYLVEVNGEKIAIASAVGHLFSLAQSSKGWSYPIFDVEWKAIYKVEKSKKYAKKYIETIHELSKQADSVIIATDYDIEGELLGYNIYRFLCNSANVKRMKFSTLTPKELRESFNKLIEVDHNLVDAGETRHILDWYWGINTSRALTLAVKSVMSAFAMISAGRVQTPALAILVEREREIADFKPKRYWEIYAKLEGGIIAKHVGGRIYEKDKVGQILVNSDSEFAVITDIKEKTVRKLPPTPFDLGALQVEAYRIFRFTPKKTQELAQSLYEAGYISYPRTSSQKLPPTIGYRNILNRLSKIDRFEVFSKALLSLEKLKPREGTKDDPAHPAIFPTGEIPGKLRKDESKLYDLIVFRFFSVFSSPAKIRKKKVECVLKNEKFIFKGSEVIERGWIDFYPYVKFEDGVLPNVKMGDKLKVIEVKAEEKETSPPPRFNPASLVRELEKRNLGTKATRAEIVDTLYRRGYIEGNPIRVTELGFGVIEALKKYVPEIISENLTREFEKKIEEIRAGKKNKIEVIDEAKVQLIDIFTRFKEKEEEIGNVLSEIIERSRTIGTCPSCGGKLKIVKSKKTKKIFVGCSNYPECTTSYPLPQKKGVKISNKKCPICGLPLVSIPMKKGRILRCINPECESKRTSP